MNLIPSALILLSVWPCVAKATPIYNVDLNTAALVGQSGAFALDFQLVAGGATINTAEVSLFDFATGAASPGSATVINGVTLNTSPLSAFFSDAANFFNELILPFNPGGSVQFQASLSNQGSGTPDAFTVAILENGNEIPMLNPDDAVVEFDYTAGGLTVISSSSNLSETALDVTSSVTPEGPVSAVPEPSSFSFYLLVAVLVLGPLAFRRWARARRVRAMVLVASLCLAGASRSSAQYDISLAVGESTPIPGSSGATFNPVTQTGGTALGTSLDGNNLVFVDAATNAIWTFDGAKGQFKELVAAGTALPDGYGSISGFGISTFLKLGTVGFIALNNNPVSPQEGIYTIPEAGGALSRIADDNTPTPDGRGNFYVGYQTGGGINASGHISMDSSHIAFDTQGNGDGGYVSNLDGSGLAPLAPNSLGLLCFLFNPYLFTKPVIWDQHIAFQGQNVFDDFWFWVGSYPPGVVSPPLTECNPGGPVNYNANISPGDVLTGGVTAGTDNQPFSIDIDDTQIVLYVPDTGTVDGLYSLNYDGTNLQPIIDPSTTLPGVSSPYSISSYSADSGSVAFTATTSNGDAIFVYTNGKFHRVVGAGDVIGGVTVPYVGGRLGLGEYSLNNGNLTFALFNTGHYVARPTYCADNMTSAVSLIRGGLRYDHASGEFLQTVTIQNNTAQAIAGPVSLVVQGLPAGVTLSAPSGITSCFSNRQPYATLTGAIGPNSSVTTTVAFHDPSFEQITWSGAVLSGVNR